MRRKAHKIVCHTPAIYVSTKKGRKTRLRWFHYQNIQIFLVIKESSKLKIASIVLVALISFPLSIAIADETAEMSFKQGSVIIRCGTPPGQNTHISNKLFEAAFPNWITSLQDHANEGLVARAHYLGILKEGIFIVVVGDDREDALSNSEIVLSDLGKIMHAAIEKTGETPPFAAEDACIVGEIGPVAILPK